MTLGDLTCAQLHIARKGERWTVGVWSREIPGETITVESDTLHDALGKVSNAIAVRLQNVA